MSPRPVGFRRQSRRLQKISPRNDRGRLWRARHFGDFECLHCGKPVMSTPEVSGVNHRNHCPYCLWSRHVDLYEAGDRLAACKEPMEPTGLAFKRIHKKYAPLQPGELMLVHRCAGCQAISLNRLAADDLPPALWDVFQASLAAPPALGPDPTSIKLLGAEAGPLIQYKLFGATLPRGLPCLD